MIDCALAICFVPFLFETQFVDIELDGALTETKNTGRVYHS